MSGLEYHQLLYNSCADVDYLSFTNGEVESYLKLHDISVSQDLIQTLANNNPVLLSVVKTKKVGSYHRKCGQYCEEVCNERIQNRNIS